MAEKTEESGRIGIMVLAAGGSTRLGEPKQLLEFEGRTLLRRAAEAALGLAVGPVVVVLGAQAERMREELQGLTVEATESLEWKLGMGASIRRGLEKLEEVTAVELLDGVLLTLCDQPLVGTNELGRIVQAFRAARPGWRGVAASYLGTRGVPALLGREFFPALRTLPVEGGAKRLLQGAGIVEVTLPEAAVDVDTRGQYEALRRNADSMGETKRACR